MGKHHAEPEAFPPVTAPRIAAIMADLGIQTVAEHTGDDGNIPDDSRLMANVNTYGVFYHLNAHGSWLVTSRRNTNIQTEGADPVAFLACNDFNARSFAAKAFIDRSGETLVCQLDADLMCAAGLDDHGLTEALKFAMDAVMVGQHIVAERTDFFAAQQNQLNEQQS